MSEALTFDRLLALHNRVQAAVEASYKFRIPKLEQELDIRDYYLREVCGSYYLIRNEDPLAEWDFLAPQPRFHPAHFIWLDGCTPRLAQSLITTYPHLERRPCLVPNQN